MIMEPMQADQSDDGMKFEYVVGKLLADIVNPIQPELREEKERDNVRLVYFLARTLGLHEYNDEFNA